MEAPRPRLLDVPVEGLASEARVLAGIHPLPRHPSQVLASEVSFPIPEEILLLLLIPPVLRLRKASRVNELRPSATLLNHLLVPRALRLVKNLLSLQYATRSRAVGKTTTILHPFHS